MKGNGTDHSLWDYQKRVHSKQFKILTLNSNAKNINIYVVNLMKFEMTIANDGDGFDVEEIQGGIWITEYEKMSQCHIRYY